MSRAAAAAAVVEADTPAALPRIPTAIKTPAPTGAPVTASAAPKLSAGGVPDTVDYSQLPPPKYKAVSAMRDRGHCALVPQLIPKFTRRVVTSVSAGGQHTLLVAGKSVVHCAVPLIPRFTLMSTRLPLLFLGRITD